MSIGFGGYADLVQADDKLVTYVYCCYNVNNVDYKQYMKMEDGEIYIERVAFVEPEIHERIKKLPSGRKKNIVKRIPRSVPIDELLSAGKIRVKNASGTWRTTVSGTDIMALKILFKLFNEYQVSGQLPEHISWFS